MSKYQLDIWEDVEKAIANAIKDYKNQNKALDFLLEVDQKFELISRNPFTYQIRFKSIRSTRLKSFPFVILYEVEGNNIRIIDLVHGSSDWLKE